MSFLEQTDANEAPDAVVEQALHLYYRHEFQHFGEPPSTEELMTRIAPSLRAAIDTTPHADHSLGPAVDAAVTPLSPKSDRRWTGAWRGRRQGMRRAGLLPVLVAVVLLLGGAALVAAPLVARIFTGDPGASAVHDQHLGREVHLAGTVAGQTMTIKWIYADANRIVLAYTVQASSGQALNCFPFNPQADELLTDTAGQQYPQNGGGGGAAIPLPAHHPAPSECVLTFDAAALAGMAPTTLHMHLALWPPCAGQPVFPASPLDPRSIVPHCPKPASQPTSEAQAQAHAGPPAIAFDLAIPFYGGTVVTVGQTLSADGKTVTLERVVVAPSDTRLYVHDIDPQIGLAPSSPPKVSSATVDGKTAFPLIAGSGADFEVVSCTRSGDCGRTSLDVVYDLPAPAVAVHGRWVVTFQSDEPQMPGDKNAPPTWTFRFQV